MRIALLTDGIYPYVVGGMQRHSYYLAKYLSRKGINVTLVHFNMSDKDISKLELFTDAEKQFIENVVIPFPKGDKLPGHYIRASYKYSILVYERLRDRLSDFDFIYSKGFSAWRLIEEKKKDPAGFPPIGVKFHGYEMFQRATRPIIIIHQQMLKRPVKWISRNADYVFSYGARITDLIKGLGVAEEHIVEIPAGIEATWISEKAGETKPPLTFTFLGRYERRKGVEELNSVLKQLLNLRREFKFNFIGAFTRQQQITSSQITYHGLVTDNNALKSLLDTTDVLVCPSWSEGMPNVILEAMARGCAILATDVGAVSLMVGRDNGILVEPGNKAELLQAFERFIQIDAAETDAMKRKSLEKIKERFVYDRIIDRFIQEIDRIGAAHEHIH